MPSVTPDQSMAIRSDAVRATVLSPVMVGVPVTVCQKVRGNARRNGAMDDLHSEPGGASSRLPHVSSLSDHRSQEMERL